MSVPSEVLDCPTCGSAGAVYNWTCEICAVGVLGAPPPPVLHPSIPLRFADVIGELRAIAELASDSGRLDGEAVAQACRRAESLLFVLRRQFLADITELEQPGVGRRPRPATFTPRSPWRPSEFTSAG